MDKKGQDTTNTISQSGLNSAGKPNRRGLILVGIVVLLILLIAGFFGYQAYQANSSVAHYSKLSKGYVIGDGRGLGASYKKPTEFGFAKEFNYSNTEANYAHYNTNGDKIGLLAVAVTKSTTSIDLAAIDSINYYMNHPESKTYKEYVSNLNTFLQARTGSTMNLNLGIAKNFTNKDIEMHKDGLKMAWQFDVSGSYKNKPDQKVKGVLMYTATDKAYYYFLLAAKANNWDANKDVWKKVTDSLEVKKDTGIK